MPLIDQVDRVRRTARQGRRSFRRVVRGSRGLSPAATLNWARGRGRDGGNDDVVENSSFNWVVADELATTRLWIHNYWSDAYGIATPTMHATLVGLDGSSLTSWSFELAEHGTVLIDIRDECRERGVALPFEGQLLLQTRAPELFPGRPLQVINDYVSADGDVSCVHGQYGPSDQPLAQVIAGMKVDARHGRRTSVVVVNQYTGPTAPPLRAEVEVVAADGRSRRTALEPLPRWATKTVHLDEVIPDLATFLGDAPGHVRVLTPVTSSRMIVSTDYADKGYRIINHGTIDRLFDQAAGVPSGWTESRPVVSAFAIVDGDLDTELTLANYWGPVRSRHQVVIDLYHGDGSPVLTHRLRLEPLEQVVLSVRELLEAQGIDTPSGVFHAEVHTQPDQRVDQSPAVIDVVVGFARAGAPVGEVQVGSDFFNTTAPPGVPVIPGKSTRIFGRVSFEAGWQPKLFLANPGSRAAHDVVGHPLVSLLDADGRVVGTLEPEVPPHGCVLLDVRDTFPGAAAMTGGAIRVRDTGARLFGYAWAEVAGTRTLPIDHLVGG